MKYFEIITRDEIIYIDLTLLNAFFRAIKFNYRMNYYKGNCILVS